MAKGKTKVVKKEEGKITDRQERFCLEYLVDFNGTQAAIRAGYSEKNARFVAAENLTKPNIQQFIQLHKEKAAAKFEITRDQIIKQYARFAFQDIRKYYNEDGSLKPIHELDDDAAAALAGVEIDELFDGVGEDKIQIGVTKKIKRWDAPKALEGLCKVLGFESPKKMEHEFGKGFADFLKSVSTK